MSTVLPHTGARRTAALPPALSPGAVPRPDTGWRRWRAWHPELSVEALVSLACVFFTAVGNGAFWNAYAASADGGSGPGWLTAVALAVAITALHAALLAALMTRWTVKPLLALVLVVTALAAFHMDRYGVYLDADMIRNVLHTERKEAGELLTLDLLPPLVVSAGLPLLLLWRVRVRRLPPVRALLRRLVFVAAALAVAGTATWLGFQDIAALMRNQHEIRYLITPGNWISSLLTVATAAGGDADRPLDVVGADARIDVAPGRRPRLLVIVVGETVRAGNWGLNGYRRQTTPELAALDVVNFTAVSACGSATEVSLPCMFSARGRRHYDGDAIRRSQSLLHVLDHAGVATLWRDNQTGCKGVCAGLPFTSFLHADVPAWCDGDRCLDEVLLQDLEAALAPGRDQVIVLHPLGNHGPSYYRRYPAAFRRYTPTCDTARLGDCSREQIVNAYDNAVLYGDHVVARTIAFLQARTEVDTGLLYVADHGESLGEGGLYLHGLPYAIAPDTQLRVPMVLWLSPRLEAAAGVDHGCLQRRATGPASHDNLFSTVLGLMQVRTSVYEPALDLLGGCVHATAPG